MNKKILHLTHTDIRSDSRILKEMAAASSNGFSVCGIGIKLNEGTKDIEEPGFEVVTLKIFSKKMRFLPKPIRHAFTLIEFFIKSFFFAIKSKPDIVHCNDTLVLPVGLFVKCFTRAKLVYDAHELESDKNGISRFLSKATLFVERLSWQFIDALIVVSPSIDVWYQAKFGRKSSAVVLNSPSFDYNFTPNKNYLREKFSIPIDKKIFLYIGILGPGRGIDDFLDVFANYSDSHLVFLGYGEYSEKLRLLSEQHHNIHVHSAVTHNRVVEIASSADVGLCLIQNISLSDYFCLPNKLFEYAFSGVPVLASNFPDISKVVNEYDLGICVDLTTTSIKSGILKFETGTVTFLPEKKKLKELSWAAQEEKLIKLYSQLN
nr:glycosyltransferase [Plesiomonas shigelloides]